MEWGGQEDNRPPAIARLQEPNFDAQLHHHAAPNRDSKPFLQEPLEVPDGTPILLEATIDSAVTMTFIHTPEVFAGRAISDSIAPTETPNKDFSCDLPRRANNRTASTDTGTTEIFSAASTPRFPCDRSISLLSRALASMDTDDPVESRIDTLPNASTEETCIPVAGLNPIQAQLSTGAPTDTSIFEPSLEESSWVSRFSGISSVLPLNAQYTILGIGDERYLIRNSEIWLLDWVKHHTMEADLLAGLIRPSFYLNVGRLGPRKAIADANGHRLGANSASLNPRDAVEAAGSSAIPVSTTSAPISIKASAADVAVTAVPNLSAATEAFETELSISKIADRLKTPSTPVNGTEISRAAAFINSTDKIAMPTKVGMDGAIERPSRLLLSPIHLIHSGSARSVNTIGTPPSESGYEVNIDDLCRFVETVREAIPNQSIDEADFKQLREIIHVLLDTESDEADERTGLSLITQIRFDKLLVDLVDLKTVNHEYMGLGAKATLLQRMWKERFKDQYLLIDHERLQAMFRDGALRGLHLDVDGETKLALWQIERGGLIPEADLKPGHFWLNIECAYRDGVVETNLEKLTLGIYDGTPILPLLSGTEVWDRGRPGSTRYRRQCHPGEIPYKLMARGEEFKGKIGVLRGHELASKFAPKAGIRYDGEYMVTHFALLPTPDPNLDVRRFELVLARIPGQKSIHGIPNPAQLDEWHLYQKYVASQKSKAVKAYSNLHTEEPHPTREEILEPNVVNANTEREFKQIFA